MLTQKYYITFSPFGLLYLLHLPNRTYDSSDWNHGKRTHSRNDKIALKVKGQSQYYCKISRIQKIDTMSNGSDVVVPPALLYVYVYTVVLCVFLTVLLVALRKSFFVSFESECVKIIINMKYK